MEYKRLEFRDSKSGRTKMETELNNLAQQGWRVISSETQKGTFNPFWPGGRKPGKIYVMLGKEPS